MATTAIVRPKRKRVRAPERVEVSCSQCGSGFTVSRRTYRYHTKPRKNLGKGAGGTPFVCATCRAVSQAPVERRKCCTRRDYSWWLRRLTPEEIAAFAPLGRIPPEPRRSIALSVLASAAPQPKRRAA